MEEFQTEELSGKKRGRAAAKEAMESYKRSAEERKRAIKADPSGWRRFWRWAWFGISWPWRWLWAECHDWRFLALFAAVCAVASSEVWVFYLLGFISWGTDFSSWCFGIATTCWAFWLGPFTPFMPLCIAITVGLRAAIDKIKARKKAKKAKEGR